MLALFVSDVLAGQGTWRLGSRCGCGRRNRDFYHVVRGVHGLLLGSVLP